MVWTSTDYFWKPAIPWNKKFPNSKNKGVAEASLSLLVEDGWRCRLTTDDCQAEDYYDCWCKENHSVDYEKGECGYEEYASTILSIEDLINLQAGINLAIAENQLNRFKYKHKLKNKQREYLIDCLVGKIEFDQNSLEKIY